MITTDWFIILHQQFFAQPNQKPINQFHSQKTLNSCSWKISNKYVTNCVEPQSTPPYRIKKMLALIISLKSTKKK